MALLLSVNHSVRSSIYEDQDLASTNENDYVENGWNSYRYWRECAGAGRGVPHFRDSFFKGTRWGLNLGSRWADTGARASLRIARRFNGIRA